MLRLPWLLLLAIASACFEDSMIPGSDGEATGTTQATEATHGGDGTGAESTADADPSIGASTSEGDDGSDASEDDTEGGSSCVAGSTCVPPVPPGWTGPFAAPLGEGDVAPPCPAAWSEMLSSVHRDLVAPPFGCSCTCTPPASACVASVGLYFDAACGSLDLSEAVDAGGCVQTNGATSVMATASTNLEPGPCAAEVETTPTPPTWQSTVTLCAPTSAPESCDQGACLPLPEEGAPLCIAQEGEHACPAGPFSVGTTFFTSVEDTRDCTGCECGDTSGAACDGLLSRLEQHGTGDCSGATLDSVVVGTCGPATASARYVPEDPGSCPVTTDTEPVGDATAGGPVTLCCLDAP